MPLSFVHPVHRATHGALPMFDDTQIDTLKLVETGQSVSRSVSFPYGIKNVLGTEDETLSPLKAASVQKSSESRCGSRGRIRTYDQSVNPDFVGTLPPVMRPISKDDLELDVQISSS